MDFIPDYSRRAVYLHNIDGDSMVNGKIRTKAHIIGEQAVRFIQNEVLPETWVSRENTPDYGIDLDVELFEYEGDKCVTLGEHLFLQIKGTEIPDYGEYYGEERRRVIKYQLETPELNLVERMGSAMPVLLILVDLKNRKAFQICLNDYIKKVLMHQNPDYKKRRTVVINIPIENEISKDNIKSLKWYGKRNKIYAMFHEMLVDIEDMKYMDYKECVIYGKKFVEHYLNYDVLYCKEFWCQLGYIRELMNEMKENDGIVYEMESFVQSALDGASDLKDKVVFPDLGCLFVEDEVNAYLYAQKLSIQHLGEVITYSSGVFETYCREWFMPGVILGS